MPEASPHRTLGRQSSGTSVIDGISRGIMGAGTAIIERLQAQVKQKDGEIVLLQVWNHKSELESQGSVAQNQTGLILCDRSLRHNSVAATKSFAVFTISHEATCPRDMSLRFVALHVPTLKLSLTLNCVFKRANDFHISY